MTAAHRIPTALAAVLALILGAPAVAAGATISVTTTAQKISGTGGCSLQEAIYAANFDDNRAPDPAHRGEFITTECAAGNGADTIALLPAGAVFSMSKVLDDANNYVGPAATPMVSSTIVIEALGARLVRPASAPKLRAFAVSTPGNLTIREAHVTGFSAHGGNGAGGGGGGLGAGGAVFVHAATLEVDQSTFEGNGTTGGNGSATFGGGGGGGGGLGGDGGPPVTEFVHVWGGGGGGSRGNGAPGGGGGGTVTDADGGTGGFACGGDAGEPNILTGGDGDDGRCRGGGGGGGEPNSGIIPPGNGGDGAVGGGGGGGGYDHGDGGHGGFGGGGGAGPAFSLPDDFVGGSGGDGGFGGGGGAGPGGVFFGDPGDGGTFAGDAGDRHGGGGAGLGGAIFGFGATITIRNSTFTGNYAVRGLAGGAEGRQGADAGGAVFAVAGSLRVLNATISGNESTGDGAGIAVYKPTTGEATSLTLRNTIVSGNTGRDECFVLNGVSAVGSNNLIVPHAEDARTPCPAITQTGDPQLGPLQQHAPGRTPTMAVAPTSPAVDTADASTSLQNDQRGLSRPFGAGFDIGAFEAGNRPPITAVTLDPASPNGSNGWYRSAVGVAVTASDPDGSVAQTRCALDPPSPPAAFDDLPDGDCALSVVSSDGRHVIYSGSRDTAGTTETPLSAVRLNIDATQPTLSPTLSATTVALNQTGVTASPNASDATSGVATAGCGPIDTSTAGDHTVTCSATDDAGNSRSATLHYLVEYRILGFFSPAPKSSWKVGTTVPVKIALADRAGTPIPDAAAAALAAACRVRFSASGAQTLSPRCMRYDAAANQFIYGWQLAKLGAGSETIRASITYPGTASTTNKTAQITIMP